MLEKEQPTKLPWSPLDVSCPLCKAPIGESCKRARRSSRPGPHKERVEIAKKAAFKL